MSTAWKSHGKGVIYKIRPSDGRRIYYIRFSYRGKRFVEKVGFSLDKALARSHARKEQLMDPDYRPPQVVRASKAVAKVPTLAAFCKQFMELYASKRKSCDRWFKPMTETLCRTWGKKRMDEITRVEIERFVTKRLKSVGPATVNHQIRFIKLLFKTAIEWDLMPKGSSPAAGVKLLRVPPPSPEDEARRFLTPDQTNALIDAASDRIVPIIQLALLTGMRRGELLGLTWPQIKDGWIRLHETKSGRERRIPVTPQIEAILKPLKRDRLRTPTQHVFLYRGRPTACIRHAWERTRERAELPHVRFHDLRHTWASRLLQRGVSTFDLMKLGGWSDSEMINTRYGHFAEDDQRAALERLAGTVGDLPQ